MTTPIKLIAGAIGLIAGIVVYFIRLPVMLRRRPECSYTVCRVYALMQAALAAAVYAIFW